MLKEINDQGQSTINQYIINKRIGVGATSKVKLLKDKETNKIYAAKICNKKKLKKIKIDKFTN